MMVAVTAARADLLTDSLNDCFGAASWSSCLKHEVLGYLDSKLGSSTPVEARSMDSLDEALVARAFKYLKGHEYGLDLPFVDARLKYRPGRSLADLDLEFKNDQLATNQARGILKKKLLLPILLLLKLKLKALMPIFVAIIGLKAMKALVLSKLAILLVVGFLAVQFFKKGGMAPPMGKCLQSHSAHESSFLNPVLILRHDHGAPGTGLRCASGAHDDLWLRAGQHLGRQRPVLPGLDAQQRRRIRPEPRLQLLLRSG